MDDMKHRVSARVSVSACEGSISSGSLLLHGGSRGMKKKHVLRRESLRKYRIFDFAGIITGNTKRHQWQHTPGRSASGRTGEGRLARTIVLSKHQCFEEQHAEDTVCL